MISDKTRQTLVVFIIETARGYVTRHNQRHFYLLLQKKEIWGSKHYAALASLMDLSIATVKRFFDLPGHQASKSLTTHTERKVLEFLGFNTWDDLETAAATEMKKVNSDLYHDEIRKVRDSLNEMGQLITVLKQRQQAVISKLELLERENCESTVNGS